MTEVTYSNSVSAHISFYKQNKNTDAINIFIKPTSGDPNVNNPLKKVFGGSGMAVFDSVVNLSGEIYFMRLLSLTG